MANWEVARPRGQCAISGRALEEGEEYYSALFERESGFERVDYSLEHWSGPPEGAYCFWKGRVPVRRKKKQLLVDNEMLIAFFKRLGDENDPLKVNFRFVLALILMRKRLLRYEDTAHDGDREIWSMRLAGEQSLHKVINPRLDDREIAAVSSQLGAILHEDMGQWDAGAEGAETADTEPTDTPGSP